MNKIWIVTNYGGGANYTPSIFKNEEAALNWLNECAEDNISAGGYSPDEVERNLNGREIIIGDPDNGGNILQLFEVEMED